MINFFEFEDQYKHELKKIKEWPYLRIRLAFMLKNNSINNVKIHKFKNIFYHILFLLRTCTYGFKNWFSKYDCLVFSDSSQRKKVDNLYFDKNVDKIIDSLKVKTLLIERPNPLHYKAVYSDYIVSNSILRIFIELIAPFFKIGYIELPSSIDVYKKTLFKQLKRNKAEEFVYRIILRVYKPRFIFVSCYNCQHGLIKSANDLNIRIIEVQHGIINHMHFSYSSVVKMDKSYFPNVLLSFGENEKNIKNILIKEIFPVGSFYLEYMEQNFTRNKKLSSLIENYDHVIGVSMQHQTWEEDAVLSFINGLAAKNQNILYILIPRFNKDFEHKIHNENIITFDELDCYNTILHCDIHSSLYSSCAIEAPTLGKPNILINYQNYAKNYYENLLSNVHTEIVSTHEEFFNAVKKFSKIENKIIRQNNRNIFYQNYSNNIKKFIETI